MSKNGDTDCKENIPRASVDLYSLRHNVQMEYESARERKFQGAKVPLCDTIMRCYFKVHSKADISQLNLLQRTKNWKVEKRTKCKKRICSEVSVNSTVWGIHGVSPEEEKEGYSENDLQKKKVWGLEWKSEGVMDDESGESMERMGEVPLTGLG